MPADLPGRVAHLQQLIEVVGALEVDDDPSLGERAKRDLQAALGAVVAWGRGSRDEASLLELAGVMAALLRRANVAILEGLSGQWRALARSPVFSDTSAPPPTDAERCLELAEVFAAAAAAVAAGDQVPAVVLTKLHGARER